LPRRQRLRLRRQCKSSALGHRRDAKEGPGADELAPKLRITAQLTGKAHHLLKLSCTGARGQAHGRMLQQDGVTNSGLMDFFERQWSSYRAIVEHDLMEHLAVAAATANAIDSWLQKRRPNAPAPRMVDLGCGDLAQLAPLLRRLPLGHYTGLDLAAVVLPMAQAALGPVSYPTAWLEGDLQAWAEGRLAPSAHPDAAQPNTDLLHSAFAIHHLDDPSKASFLKAARQRINTGGLFIWVDVFREPDESREAYVTRYQRRINASWPQLSAEQKNHVISHLSSFDIPADREAIAAAAAEAGWQWRWGWQGAYQAEAMAVLTPI